MATPPFGFDETNPLDTALISTFPANERTFRDNVNDWNDFEHGSASGRHKIPTGNDAARDAITDWETGSLWISTQGTLPSLQINNGTKVTPDWEDVTGITTVGDLTIGVAAGMATRLAVGAAETHLTSNGTAPAWSTNLIADNGLPMLFQTTTAPTGWTKETTHNNKALRLQTGTVTTGGADSFTTVFGSGTHRATNSHTLTTSQIPSHSHVENANAGENIHITGGGAPTAITFPLSATINQSASLLSTAVTGGGGSHSHNIDSIDLQFVDVIIATKD